MAERIGESLVRNGVISAADLERGLSDARASGIRLASALVRLGKMSADDASRALAEQHGVPAALTKHLAGRDLALASQLPGWLAREMCAIPIAVSRNQQSLVVCVRDPLPATSATLTGAIGKPVVMAVAVECVLAPIVAETYPPDAADDDDFDVDMDSGVTDVPEEVTKREDSSPYNVGSLQLVDLDDHGVSKDHLQGMATSPAMPPRATTIPPPTRSTGPFAALSPPEASLELPNPSPRIAVARVATEPAIIHAPVPPPATANVPKPRQITLDAALVAINRAETRDFIVDTTVAFLRHRFEAGVVFSVKDDLALGQSGFGGDLDDDAVTALTVPMSQKSVLRAAYVTKEPFIGAPTETGVVQDRFFRLMGNTPAWVVVVPVAIKGRVISLLYAHGTRVDDDESAAAELRTLAKAVEDAYVRIIREAKES